MPKIDELKYLIRNKVNQNWPVFESGKKLIFLSSENKKDNMNNDIFKGIKIIDENYSLEEYFVNKGNIVYVILIKE